jgi:predicted enzyme related to lactoylglutathione lyase
VDRLLYVIVYTTDLAATTRFYRDRLGLESAQDNSHWVDYRTGGARLATMAIHPRMACEVELSFHVPELETTVASLRARGVTFMGEIKTIPFGRLAHLRDPNGTLLSLYAPDQAPQELDGPPALLLTLNADDLAGTVAFYRDTLGFEVAEEERGRVVFETGGTRLAVQRRARGGDHPEHAAQKVVFGLEVPDLGRAASEARSHGLHFSTAPTDDDLGAYAEAIDPEGNLVVFREPAAVPALEEVLAEAYDDDDAPARSAIRRPVQKQSKAVSRVVIKPDYKPKKAAARGAATPATRARRESAASTRGAGPAGTRLKPKTTRDPKRAKAKPAAGRAKKASVRAAADKKRAVARASKGRPVKRAVSRGGGRGR